MTCVACFPGTRIGGSVGSGLRLRRNGAVVLLLLLLLASPVLRADADRVVDFAGETAVFEIDGRLVVVRRDADVPGTGARLRHVGAEAVLIDFAAQGAHEAVTVELKRGSPLARPAPDPQVMVPIPAALARVSRAGPASSTQADVSGRTDEGKDP